ncbi:histidine kinase [Catenulispora yoronensis]|uniref:histidine kinase n=1 Tax=Catenulispora yoronensis TaxID=450799 RepID=A0ABP5EYA6_9ACTN
MANRSRLPRQLWTVVDAMAAIVVGAAAWNQVQTFSSAFFDPHHRGYPKPTHAQVALVLTGVVVVGLAMALRRRGPFTAAAMVLAVWTAAVVFAGGLMMTNGLGAQIIVAGGMVVYLVAATRPLPVGLAMLAAALGATQLTWFGSYELWHNWLLAALVQITAWALGYAVGRYRAYGVAVREQHAEAVRAELTDERIRLARELHDVIAHSMSVVNVQAGFGHFVIDKDPAQAKTALATIQATSREALKEMRGLLGVLRDGSSPDTSALLPAPTLADLDRLVASCADAGVRVHVTVRGERRELSPGIEVSAFRIVQEALTNVVKHAHIDAARAIVEYRPDTLVLEVTDSGRGGPVAEGGHGLAGMEERVGLYGGTLEAGPLPARGFRVRAVLPA